MIAEHFPENLKYFSTIDTYDGNNLTFEIFKPGIMEAKMKKILIGTTLILLLCIAGFSQKSKKSPNDLDSAAKKDKNQSVLLQSGTSLEGQLQSTLDVKKARVGDEVVLRTTKSVKQDGETIVPKGTNLIGRVTEVQQKTKNGGSRLGMVFDRIEGKNLAAPINASIVGITNSNSNANVADVVNSSSSSSTNSSARASSGGSGGGLLGGVTSTVGGVVNTTTNTVGGVTNGAGQTVGGVTQPLGGALKGIQLSNSVSGSAQSSTTLSAQDKNIRLEKGTTFQLRLDKSVQN